MKTQTYESIIIINATLDDSQIDSVISRVEKTVSTDGGDIFDVEKWGRKRLTYPIQKSKNGYYVIFRFTAPTESITKIERMYRLDEAIVRYLTTIMELKDIENFNKVKHDMMVNAAAEKEISIEVKADEPKEEVVSTETLETEVEEVTDNDDDNKSEE